MTYLAHTFGGRLAANQNDPPVAACTCGQPIDFASVVTMAAVHVRLTPKEREVFALLFKGLSTKEMAQVLGNTEKTLKHHISSVYKQFGVEGRAELFHLVFPT